MTTCERIKVDIPENSPVYSLYNKLKTQFSVTDEVFDAHGHYEVNYKQPGTMPFVKGVGDCYIGPADVLDFAFDDWKKYQKPIEESTGEQLSWAIDDNNSAYPFNPQTKELSKRVIESSKNAAAKAGEIIMSEGVEIGSERYQEMLASYMFAFARFPTLDVWKGMLKKDKKSWMNLMAEFDLKGMGEFQKFLLENGGLGLREYFRYKLIPTMFATTGLETLEWGGGSGQLYLLYSIYDMVGLNPQFVEKAAFVEKDDLANELHVGTNAAVGIHIGGRIFFPGDREMTQKRNYYPMALRHMLFNKILLSSFQKGSENILERQLIEFVNKMKRTLFYGEDVTSTSCLIRSFLLSAEMTTATSDNLLSILNEKMIEESGSDICFFAGVGALSSSDKNKTKRLLRTLIASHNIEMALVGLILGIELASDENDFATVQEYAEKALAIAPDNPKALLFVALSIIKLGNENLSKAEKMLKRVIKLSPQTGMAYSLLGVIHSRQGDFKNAAKELQLALKKSSVSLDKIIYLLGWSLWQSGNKEEALKTWKKLPLIFESPQKVVQIGDEQSQDLLANFKEISEEFPPSLEMIKNHDVVDTLSLYLGSLGDVLIYHDHLLLARDAFLKALEMKPSAKIEAYIRWELSLVYQQTDNIDGAKIEVKRAIESR
jgi:tetratricopeptide (TPR) repeat protein